MDLSGWNERLDKHFWSLRQLRKNQGGAHSIFALEHGLDDEELEDLINAVRAHVRRHAPDVKHQLAWIVYAAEIGYRYDGTEYWQTFEDETPQWQVHGDRHWIRKRFQRFHEFYGGARPKGNWAESFSIICWPLTHAVLPKDLQVQLARTLFEVRKALRPEHLDCPKQLGRLLAGHGNEGSSRFQNFLQEHELVRQIASALLLQDEDQGEFLEQKALHRIVTDLEGAEDAKLWLRFTKASVRQRVSGLRTVSVPTDGRKAEPAPALQESRQPVPPTFDYLLVPRSACWRLYLDIPDCSGFASATPELRQWLADTTCRVEGSQRGPLARGALLRKPEPIHLLAWPQVGKQLLQFQKKAPPCASEFLSALEVSRRPPRLFKLQSDGMAHALRNEIVHPGMEYVLVSPDQLPQIPGSAAVPLDGHGVNAARFTVAQDLDGWKDLLDELGLAATGRLRLWPVGVVPLRWDDSGRGEWLEQDLITLGIEVSGFGLTVSLTLDEQEILTLTPEVGRPALWYVQLPPLTAGRHEFRCYVSQRGQPGGRTYLLDIIVRKPRGHTTVGSGQTPMHLVTDPPYPRLEQLWEDQVELQLSGPAGHSIQVSLELLESSRGGALQKFSIPPLTLPVGTADWSAAVEQVRKKDRIAADYDRARLGRLTFDGGALGILRLECERTHTPLRWTASCHRSRTCLRLVDETGASDATRVFKYNALRPDLEEPLLPDKALTGLAVDGAALYVAANGSCCSAIVATKQKWNLHELRQDPEVRPPLARAETLEGLVELIRCWHSAHQSGNVLAATFQERSIDALQHALIAALCGSHYAAAERQYRANASLSNASERLLAACTGGARRLVLRKSFVTAATSSLFADKGVHERAQWLREHLACAGLYPLLNTSPIRDPDWLISLALCLASAPASAPACAGERLGDGLRALLRQPELAAIARALVVVLKHDSSVGAASGGTMKWEWE